MRALLRELLAEAVGAGTDEGWLDEWTALLLARPEPEEARSALLAELAQWMASVNRQNYDGISLTPPLATFLLSDGSLTPKLERLEQLRTATLHGHFDSTRELQRDLEFHHFEFVYKKEISQARGEYPEAVQVTDSQSTLYDLFRQLPQLPLPVAGPPAPMQLSLEFEREARRAAFEATTFLGFVSELRTRTSREILIAANDRYGRQWVVEPLRRQLLALGGVSLCWPRVPSHLSTRLTVPRMIGRTGARAGFGRETVEELSSTMPHVLVVDARSPAAGATADEAGRMRFSRGARDMTNWFLAFNHIRSGGTATATATAAAPPAPPAWLARTPIPAHHYSELSKWYEFEEVARQLQAWVSAGPAYEMAMWAPQPAAEAMLGDVRVEARILSAAPTTSSDSSMADLEPTMVLVNPVIYTVDKPPYLPSELAGSTPYFFDGPEALCDHSVRFGFGAFGVESRVEGRTTDEFVAAVQAVMEQEIERLVAGGSVPSTAACRL